ncbi:olfactory receptor 52n2-like, partial [Lynx pardinus]
MYGVNSSRLTPRYFILNGIPKLEVAHTWISLTFCIMYIIAVLGNCGLIHLISHKEVLHRPMYYFLSLLSPTDVNAWIDFNACLVHVFFIHMLTSMECGVLMLMALDCYVAICYPLHYSTILTNTAITKVGFATCSRSVLFTIPFTFLITHLPFCRGNLIHHTYSDHMSLAKLTCGNIKIDAIYGLVAVILIAGFDIFCTCMSYTLIICAVVNLSSADACHKAFSTCTSHIGAVVITYVPAFFNFFTHRFGGRSIPHHVHIFIANLYMLLPPTLNPIVSEMKTKQIREGVIKLFFTEKDNM